MSLQSVLYCFNFRKISQGVNLNELSYMKQQAHIANYILCTEIHHWKQNMHLDYYTFDCVIDSRRGHLY